ncbi:MAG: succinate dehydrogenase assembly factor 2 [Thermodesulfobacteriota bacterium]|nr:succinate dehydrogenase assembly factor 2 [Thermodesulfobacteriota bacterium]
MSALGDRYRRKLRYLTARRATRELEVILERFWARHGATLPDEDLPDLERILSLDDLDLLAILLAQKPLPDGYRRDLFERMR